MLTGSESLLKMLVKLTTSTEKRLIIDKRTANKASKKREITNVWESISQFNIVASLTKMFTCKELGKIVEKQMLDVLIEQWTERDAAKLIYRNQIIGVKQFFTNRKTRACILTSKILDLLMSTELIRNAADTKNCHKRRTENNKPRDEPNTDRKG